ncbi:MAG: aspartyl protease [Chloroflexota bacterium]|nr:aspartyl protease [Chloroflexota bacterium]
MATVSFDREAAMGRIDVTLTVTNTIDQARAEAGDIVAASVRSVTLDGVLVDTGATFLSLPADVIAGLGLRPVRDVMIGTATGPQRARLYGDARLALLGREGTFDCLELPGATQPLLGVIPMEALGLEPDLAGRRLRLLPDQSPDSYITAL